MAVAFQTKSRGNGSGTTSVAITEPASATTDDILLLWFLCANNTVTATTPSGWNLLKAFTGGANGNAYVWWIRRGGSAPTLTVSLSTSDTYHEYVCLRYSGCETSGNPYDQFASTGPTTQTTAPDGPSVTTTVTNTVVVVFGTKWGGSSGAVWGAPSGYTIRDDGGSIGNDLCVADKSVGTATTEDPGVFTNNTTSSDMVCAATLALKPPAPAAVTATIAWLTA